MTEEPLKTFPGSRTVNPGASRGTSSVLRPLDPVLLDRTCTAKSLAIGAFGLGGVIYSLEGKAISESSGVQPNAGFRQPQWGVTPRRTRGNWLTAYSAAGGKVRCAASEMTRAATNGRRWRRATRAATCDSMSAAIALLVWRSSAFCRAENVYGVARWLIWFGTPLLKR